MILDERGMKRARGLARELVRVEKEKERERTRQAINNFKDTVADVYNAIRTVVTGVENAFGKMVKLPSKPPKSLNELPIEISLQSNPSIEITPGCRSCNGTGKLRAMQRMAVIGGGSVRGPDTTTECNFCNGTGRK